MPLYLSGFFHTEGQQNMADRMATRIQLDPVRTNLAHREGAEAAHMPTSLSILAQSLPWREFVFAEGDRVATLIATLGVKLCFFGKPGFFKRLSRYKEEESENTQSTRHIGNGEE